MIRRYVETDKLKPRQKTLNGLKNVTHLKTHVCWHSLINVMTRQTVS